MINVEIELPIVLVREGEKKNTWDEMVVVLYINMHTILAFHAHPLDKERMVIQTSFHEEYTVDMSVKTFLELRDNLLKDLDNRMQNKIVPVMPGPQLKI